MPSPVPDHGRLWMTLLPLVALGQSAPVRITVPTVIVTAQKEPADIQGLPVSVTAASKETIADAGISIVSDAAMYAPNTYFSEFTARALSFARFRGIGSSPANPGITTYIDGVPQLNTNSSSIDFLDVDQVEFVRGPQSALFGRNTLGGLVSVTSSRPSLTAWTGSASVPFGNFGAREVRAGVSGPLTDRLAVGFADGSPRSRWLHHERPDGQRPRLSVRHLRQGPGALDARGQLGGPRHRHRRAGAGWRPGVERPRGAARRIRSRPRATSRAATIGTSCRRPCWRGARGSGSPSRAPPGSSAGRPALSPTSITRRCRSSRATTPKRTRSSPRRFGWRRRPTRPSGCPMPRC